MKFYGENYFDNLFDNKIISKVDFHKLTYIYLQSRLILQEIIIVLATKIIFTKDLVKVTNLSQNFIVLTEILDADWLDFAILIASILRNNKFCFCLAQKNSI